MNKIVTRGFGRNATSQGIVTQGYGGFFRRIAEETQRLVKLGKVKGKKFIDDVEVTVRVTLVSINDRVLNITGASRAALDNNKNANKVSISFVKQKILETIRVTINKFRK